MDDWLIELVELATETGLAVQETKDACGKTEMLYTYINECLFTTCVSCFETVKSTWNAVS